MSNKVLITNSQKAVKVPSGLRILIRRACNAVLEYEHFDRPAEISVTFVDNAKIVLEQYETLVLEHLSDTSLDYGICKLSQGIIDMMERKPEAAEINLLGAESIIGNAVGTDNDYMRTTYRYLNNLYARWMKPEKAIEYKDKFLGVKREIP